MRGRLNKLICAASLFVVPCFLSAEEEVRSRDKGALDAFHERMERVQKDGGVEIQRSTDGNRASATIQYDSGNLTIPTFGFNVTWGNLFDQVQDVPVFSSGSISQFSFYVPANGSYYLTGFGYPRFRISMADDVITYPSYSNIAIGYTLLYADIYYAGTTRGTAAFSFISPLQFAGNKILAGMVNDNTFISYTGGYGYTYDPYSYCGTAYFGPGYGFNAGGCIGLDSGTNLSQGHKAFSGFYYGGGIVVGFPYSGLNAMFRISGNLAAEDIPVELMDFQVN